MGREAREFVEHRLGLLVAEHLEQPDREGVIEEVVAVVETDDRVAGLEADPDLLVRRAGVPPGVLDARRSARSVE